MYFEEKEVQHLLTSISKNFSNFVLIAELMPAFTANNERYHDTVRQTKAQFKWGVDSGKELVKLCPYIRLVKENSFNVIMKQYSVRGWLFALLPKINKMNNRLATFISVM